MAANDLLISHCPLAISSFVEDTALFTSLEPHQPGFETVVNSKFANTQIRGEFGIGRLQPRIQPANRPTDCKDALVQPSEAEEEKVEAILSRMCGNSWDLHLSTPTTTSSQAHQNRMCYGSAGDPLLGCWTTTVGLFSRMKATGLLDLFVVTSLFHVCSSMVSRRFFFFHDPCLCMAEGE